MSLINQMLQDLDARRAAHGVGVSLPNEVRPLPPHRASRWPWLLAALAGVALVAGGAFYVLMPTVVVPPAVSTAPALPAAAPVPTNPPEPAVSAPSPEQVVRQSTDALSVETSLRLADVLSAPAVAKPVGAEGEVEKRWPETKQPEDKQMPLANKPEAPKAPAPSAAQFADSRAAKHPSIEKTDTAVLPRDRGEASYRKAIAAANQGRMSEALDGLQETLRLDSLHVAARQLLVRLLLEAKRHDEALLALQEGVQGQPAQTGWAMSLARLQVERGDLTAAAQTLQHSLPAAMTKPDYLGFAAHVQQRLGRYKEAAGLYELAARLAPGDGRWWLGLGLAMEAEGRNDQATAAFQRARQSGNLSRELMALVEQKLR